MTKLMLVEKGADQMTGDLFTIKPAKILPTSYTPLYDFEDVTIDDEDEELRRAIAASLAETHVDSETTTTGNSEHPTMEIELDDLRAARGATTVAVSGNAVRSDRNEVNHRIAKRMQSNRVRTGMLPLDQICRRIESLLNP
jgi:hypothetical protein